MEIIETLFSLIKPTAIMSLPLEFKAVVLLVIASLLIQAVRSLLKFRLLKMAFALFYAIIFAGIASTVLPALTGSTVQDEKPAVKQKNN